MIRHKFPDYPRPCAVILLAMVVAIGVLVFGAVGIAHASTAYFRWCSENSSLCAYDRGLNQQLTMGGYSSSTNWSRSDCGNRTADGITAYFCKYQSKPDGYFMTADATNNFVGVTSNCGCDSAQLFSDPVSGAVYNLYDLQQGEQYYMSEEGHGVFMAPFFTGNQVWQLIPNPG